MEEQFVHFPVQAEMELRPLTSRRFVYRRQDGGKSLLNLATHLWMSELKLDPQEPVAGKGPKSVRAFPAQDDHLMSQCDKLELQ